MYFLEIFGSLLMVTHGLLTIALIDNLKSLKLIRFAIKFTKILMIIYILLIIMRLSVYMRIYVVLSEPEINTSEISFGNFLASYMADDSETQVYLTMFLLVMFAFCFLVNFFTLRTTN